MADIRVTDGRLDFPLVVARAFVLDCVYQDPPGTAFDLTGATGVCQIRAEPGGQLLLSPTVEITDAVAGAFRISASSTDTAGLLPGRARYEVTFDFDDGLGDRQMLTGTVTIVRGVVA